MTAGETTTYVLGQLAIPPTSLILLAIAGLVVALRRRVLGLTVAALSLISLLALSTTVVAHTLIRTLEPPALATDQRAGAQAIVILAGGRNRVAPEWNGETVNSFSLRRVRYGASLARQTGLPVLLSGGNPERAPRPEARLMQDVLEREFGIKARWIEEGSDTTAENARFSADILRPLGITRVLLVTDAFHMPRAQLAFARAGLAAVAAPTGYIGRRDFGPQHLVPNAEALRVTNLAAREWIAGRWYRVRD